MGQAAYDTYVYANNAQRICGNKSRITENNINTEIKRQYTPSSKRKKSKRNPSKSKHSLQQSTSNLVKATGAIENCAIVINKQTKTATSETTSKHKTSWNLNKTVDGFVEDEHGMYISVNYDDFPLESVDPTWQLSHGQTANSDYKITVSPLQTNIKSVDTSTVKQQIETPSTITPITPIIYTYDEMEGYWN
eukprot:139675_1